MRAKVQSGRRRKGKITGTRGGGGKGFAAIDGTLSLNFQKGRFVFDVSKPEEVPDFP